MDDEVKLIVKFPSVAEREAFLVWLCDGGGEQVFMDSDQTQVNHFNYGQCFGRQGNNHPTLKLEVLEED